MPKSTRDVEKFFARMAILETQMKNVMSFQKWQMGVLAALLLLAVTHWLH